MKGEPRGVPGTIKGNPGVFQEPSRGTQGCSRNNQGEPRGIPGTIKGNLGGIPGTIKRNPGVFEEP